MPTYEYLCQACSHRFETWQKMTDEPLTICPECGGHIRRILFPAGIVFKGHGFYKTDHGNGAIPASNGNGHGEPKKSEETATEAHGESKPSANGTSSTSAAGDKSSAAGVK
jgi:putative FmdB family regulatory protein